MWNMFKVNNKSTKTKLRKWWGSRVLSFFTPFFSVSNDDFEEVNVNWEVIPSKIISTFTEVLNLKVNVHRS